MQIMIRASIRSDFAAIQALLSELWPEMTLDIPDMQKVFEEGLRSSHQSYISALSQEQLVGFCDMVFINGFWQAGLLVYINAIIVDKNFRGQGIGTLLLQQVFQEAKHRDCRYVMLDSASHRTEAHAFYHKHGFEQQKSLLFMKQL